ncbi:MAG: DUF4091 domain-containing protein [Candidatus Hydrogenedentes bacterium]|nr:DUF4091 domain-containing protein [Candidatus Hydrogenedentota bacterium]
MFRLGLRSEVILFFSLLILSAHAQTIALPAIGTPEWKLSGGQGDLPTHAQTESHALSVTGDGADTNHWRTPSLELLPSTVYEVRFRAMGHDAVGGLGISGPDFCNRDFIVQEDRWKDYTSLFMTPDSMSPDNAWLRFGQWHVNGTVLFDSVSLTRVLPVHETHDGMVLGSGEQIAGNDYDFSLPIFGHPSNVARPLLRYSTRFNTHRWEFSPGSEVVYRHEIATRELQAATLDLNVSAYQSGTVAVEVDREDEQWRALGVVGANGFFSFPIPDELFPAAVIRIRLRGVADANGATQLDLDSYRLRATLSGDPITMEGNTHFVAFAQADPRLDVTCLSLGDGEPGGDNRFVVKILNTTGAVLPVDANLTVTPEQGEPLTVTRHFDLSNEPVVAELPYDIRCSGVHTLACTVGTPDGIRMEAQLNVASLFDATYGELLPAPGPDAALWWCSSGWKVSRSRPAPEKASDAILIRAAQNEAEAAQVVLRPSRPINGLTATVEPLQGPGGAVLPAEQIEVLRVRYVDVTRPTDATGAAAPWPDPLPRFTAPIDLAPGENQPFWIRVTAPSTAAPGTYAGLIRFKAEGFEAAVPLHVEIYGFALPTRPTCVTAFGFSPGDVYRYHRIEDPAQQREVIDKYLQSFSKHRITPYDPTPLDNFQVTWPGVDAYKAGTTTDIAQAFTPVIDWTAWDVAMAKAIDEYGFNSFRLSIVGMGGGTFHSRTDPSLLGYAEDTPEYKAAFDAYCKQVQEHLREKGWLDEAYVYWFDEPDPKDYDFVMNGFRRIHEAAPGINRMLTEQVESGLIGGPNIWCPISDAFDMEDAEARRAEGEKFWWYVCTAPKAPYCTLFIDHAATELRVWLWQTWQRKIDGILIWQSNYWTSDAAYPNEPQNPYADPMGWTSGYSTKAGHRLPWGNGDGRFMYPPEAAADGQQPDPVLEGPVDSIRWEMLRDGVEDYEYHVILRELITAREKAGQDAASLAPYRALLEVPEAITASVTEFTLDPAPIEARRHELAKAIEALAVTQ